MKHKTKCKNGFSMIEMAVAMAIFSIISVATISAFVVVVKARKDTESLQQGLASIRTSIEIIAKNIRMSSSTQAVDENLNSQDIRMFNNSQGKCMRFRFNDGRLESSEIPGVQPDDCPDIFYGNWQTLAEEVSGSFLITPSNIGSQTIGKISILIKTGKNSLQTSISFRDYEGIVYGVESGEVRVDGECLGSENCANCPEDCGVCPVSNCNNGICDSGEDCDTCPSDCGCETGYACSSGSCVATSCTDTCSSLGYNCGMHDVCGVPTDCGNCCGVDGCQASIGETCSTCETDCGACVSGGLILHMEDSSFSDSINPPHQVAVVGGVSLSSDGASGNSASFDGTGELVLADSPDWDLSTSSFFNFTIDFWMKATAADCDMGVYMAIAGNYNGGNSGWWFYVLRNTHPMYFYGQNVTLEATECDLCDNDWHHVATVGYGSQNCLYIDGHRQSCRAVNSEAFSSEDLSIGRGRRDIPNYMYKGLIDEFRILKGTSRWSGDYFIPPDPPSSFKYCGDRTCNNGENCSTCQSDCGACAPDCGTDSETSRVSCVDIKNDSSCPGSSGMYWINPSGASAFQVYCDMVTDGGGWGLVANARTSTLSIEPLPVLDTVGSSFATGILSDEKISAMLGASNSVSNNIKVFVDWTPDYTVSMHSNGHSAKGTYSVDWQANKDCVAYDGERDNANFTPAGGWNFFNGSSGGAIGYYSNNGFVINLCTSGDFACNKGFGTGCVLYGRKGYIWIK